LLTPALNRILANTSDREWQADQVRGNAGSRYYDFFQYAPTTVIASGGRHASGQQNKNAGKA